MKYVGTLLGFLGVLVFVVTCWLTWAICWFWGGNSGLAAGFWLCGGVTSVAVFGLGCIVYAALDGDS